MLKTPYFTLMTDHALFNGLDLRVLEFVLKPTIAVTGDEGRLDEDRVLDSFEAALTRLQTSTRDFGPESAGLPLEEIFLQGWSGAGDKIKIVKGLGARIRSHQPGADLQISVHYSVGVPITGLYRLLNFAQSQARDDSPSSDNARRHLVEGLDFGSEFAALFAAQNRQEFQGHGDVPGFVVDLLSADEDVVAVRGFLALAYTQAAARTHILEDQEHGLHKHYLAAASRTSLSGMRKELSKDVRKFLDKNATRIRNRFVEYIAMHHGATERDFLAMRVTRGTYDALHEDWFGGSNVADYLDNALRTSSTELNQNEALNVRTNFLKPDSNPTKILRRSRLKPSAAVLELRHHGPRQRNIAQFRAGYKELSAPARSIYTEAPRIRTAGGEAAEQRRLAAPLPARTSTSTPTPTSTST